MVFQKVPHAIFKERWKDKGVKGMSDVCQCFACSAKLSSDWSVQIAIVSFHKRAVFCKMEIAKNIMFYARIDITRYGVRFNNLFLNRRAVKIAHQADKSFRWTYDFKSSVQTSRMSLRSVIRPKLKQQTARSSVQTKLSVNVGLESFAAVIWWVNSFQRSLQIAWGTFFWKGLRGGLFVLANKRLNKKSPFWDYTN